MKIIAALSFVVFLVIVDAGQQDFWKIIRDAVLNNDDDSSDDVDTGFSWQSLYDAIIGPSQTVTKRKGTFENCGKFGRLRY